MRSRDEAASSSTSALRPTGRARPRDAGRDHRNATSLIGDAPLLLEPVAVPELPTVKSRLRGLLFGVDAIALAIGWAIGAGIPALRDGTTGGSLTDLLLVVVAGIVVGLFMIASQGLYRSRVCAVRAVETARLGRAAAASVVAGLLVASRLGLAFGVWQAVAVLVGTWFVLTAARSLYCAWLQRARTLDRFCRPVVIIGTGDEAQLLYRLVELHPELGLRVSGVVGPRHTATRWEDEDVEWLGDIAEAGSVVRDVGASGVIVAVSDLGTNDLNRVTRELLKDGVHVQLSSGLRGIDQRRLRSVPLAHEPLFYLEPASLSRWQLGTKRVMDLLLASVILLVASPVLLVVAAAVKLGDGGPVLFHQSRVGKHGRSFRLHKFRTMVPDAEEQLIDLTFANERQDGPLFKLTQDPRRTKVGRILERTSLDELPQLLNVLRGEMSLVGPRPALAHEVEQFDDELQGRHQVPPGITGLWQVEGREKPAFDVYRRLDLFYVENWSVGFDLAILLATFQSVMLRFVWRSSKAAPAMSPAVVASVAQGS